MTLGEGAIASDGNPENPGYGYEAYAIDLVDSPLVPSSDGVQPLDLVDDDDATEISLGENTFRFYGVNYNKAWISTNGKISFGDYDSNYSNTNLTTSSNPQINVFWDDLYPNGTNRGFYKIDDNKIIVDWQDIPHISAGGVENKATFQAILELNTVDEDGYILLNYYDALFGNPEFDNGKSATIGIHGTNNYLNLSYNNDSLLSNYDSILISTNGTVGLDTGHDADSSNSIPATADHEIQLSEDHDYVFSSADFLFDDPDNGDSLKAVLITSAPTKGRLLYDGIAIDVGTNGYQVGNSDLNKLVFVPETDANGDSYSSFGFKVIDQADAASEEATLTVHVDAVNDLPVINISDSTLSGTLKEAGSDSTGIAVGGVSSVSGSLSATDVDAGTGLSWSIVGEPSTTYGSLLIDSTTGVWTYQLDNSRRATEALLAGESKVQTFAVRATDPDGAYDETTIEITIDGSDDIIRQFADHVIAVSSEGQGDASDRWNASQALGSPDTEQYGDLDTAWSPIRRNASGGNDAEEFLSVGFRRPVKATGFVIHESFGNGFIRRVEAIDTANNHHELWVGEDDTPADLSGFSINLPQPTNFLVKGLKISVDIDHTTDWEQIDAVELIGWATEETYRPLAPTLKPVAGNGVVNSSEKQSGVVLSGEAEPDSTIELAWGDFSASTTTSSGRQWSILVPSSSIPADALASTISVVATDTEGYSSNAYTTTVRINTAAPSAPSIAVVAGDNRINAYEKSNGVRLAGSAGTAATAVELSWAGAVHILDVAADGTWSVVIGGANGDGAIPADSPNSVITVVAVDLDGNRSEPTTHQLVIDTSAPSAPSLNPVAVDNTINAAEKSAGVNLSGTAESGTTVSLQWGNLLRSTAVDSNGAWTILVDKSSVPDDILRSLINLRAIDIAGNQSGYTRERVDIDTIAPGLPLIDQVASDDIVNANEASQAVTITGHAERGSLVEVDWNGNRFSTTATLSGRWSINVDSSGLPSHGLTSVISAVATDSAGNRSASARKTVISDYLAPDAPTLNPVGSNGKVNASLRASGLSISGTAEAGAMIDLSWSRFVKQAIADAAGRWTASVTGSELPRDGTYPFTVIATDVSGNSSVAVTQTAVIDTAPPRAPKFSGKIAGDSIISAVERAQGVNIQGTSEIGTSVSVSFAGVTKAATMTGGQWQVSFAASEIPLGLGLKQSVVAIASDLVGNPSEIAQADVVLNTTPPSTPLIDVIAGNDLVNSQEAAAGIVLSGTGDAGSRVAIALGSSSLLTTVNNAGRWSLTLPKSSIPLLDGTNLVVATATNTSGLTSPAATRSYQLDRTPPVVISASTEGSSLILEVSKPLQIASISSSQFTIREGRSSLGIVNASVVESDSTKLRLELTAPLSSSGSLSIDYQPNGLTTQVSDGAGNALARFRGLAPTTYKSPVNVITLASNYTTVELTGNSAVQAIGNNANNQIIGNSSDNVLVGGLGRDILTGARGRDVFRYNSHSESTLGTATQPNYDYITDFEIGTDVIDGPIAISRGGVQQFGSVASLTLSNITSLLTNSVFAANAAATFSLAGNRWFLALNDTTPGFSSQDALIEFTGFKGQLNDLQIV